MPINLVKESSYGSHATDHHLPLKIRLLEKGTFFKEIEESVPFLLYNQDILKSK
ncbi:hypothetical protein GYMC10_5861 [Paenibacillus sp. Y412MC10]|nr:hypothetical protein GYMC10_5861 [Paenibacillus sp. Y412MC10]ETT67817.1 hypothetical protein C172_05642 [Paenibacillus sp. FSL H8-457]